MPDVDRSRWMMFITVAVLTVCGGGAYTQDEIEPTNDLPNPYRTTAPWGKLPDGRKWGALNAVAIDNDGESVLSCRPMRRESRYPARCVHVPVR